MIHRYAWCCALILIVLADVPVHGGDRYWAMLRDGQQVTGSQLRGLYDWKKGATLDGKPLFDAQNPVRTLRDTVQASLLRGPYVEMTNGDVLPGVAVGMGGGSPSVAEPEHLIVELIGSHGPQREARSRLRVRWDSVKRIVAAESSRERFEPNLIVLRDGQRMIARGMRWSNDGVRALSDGGVTTAGFSQLSEVHLPDRSEIAGLMSDARWSLVCPDDSLVRISTTSGGQYTIPRSMIAVEVEREGLGRRSYTFNEALAIQPAWALDTIFVPTAAVVSWAFRDFDEVPLSLLPVSHVQERPGIYHWPWRRNQSVFGTALRTGALTADLGLGTNSYSELVFELPQRSREFTATVGLDRSVGSGGCVQCRVYPDDTTRQPLWQSGFLSGADGAVKVEPVPLDGANRVVLVTDYGHEGRPAGADPHDIRDHVNWLLPMVKVDLDTKRRSEDLADWIPELRGWQLSDEMLRRVTLKPTWDRYQGRWQFAMLADADQEIQTSSPLVLTQKIKVSLSNAYVPIEVARDDSGDGAHEIQVFVNGGQHSSTMNGDIRTEYTRREIASRLWVLGEYAGQEVTVSVVITPRGKPTDKPSGLLWQSLALRPIVENLPRDGNSIKPDVLLTSLKPLSQSIEGEEVKIEPGKLTNAKELAIRGFPFHEGFGVPVESELTYALDPNWRRFVAVIGLSDGWQGAGPYEILLDGQPHWQGTERYKRNDPGAQIEIPIPPGHQTITLRLAGRSCYGAWADAGFKTD